MRYLNKTSLNIICAVQCLRAFAICDGCVNRNAGDYFATCRDYYGRIPDNVIAKAGLRKNDMDFRLVLEFTVTDEMKRTRFKRLGKFVLDPCG